MIRLPSATVNQLMALCDDIEAKLCEAEAQSKKLMNSAAQHVLQTVSSARPVSEQFQLSPW